MITIEIYGSNSGFSDAFWGALVGAGAVLLAQLLAMRHQNRRDRKAAFAAHLGNFIHEAISTHQRPVDRDERLHKRFEEEYSKRFDRASVDFLVWAKDPIKMRKTLHSIRDVLQHDMIVLASLNRAESAMPGPGDEYWEPETSTKALEVYEDFKRDISEELLTLPDKGEEAFIKAADEKAPNAKSKLDALWEEARPKKASKKEDPEPSSPE